MRKIYFCNQCRKLLKTLSVCSCGSNGEIRPVKLGTPVNVIGTKLKGKVYRIQEEGVAVLITSNKLAGIKTYGIDEIRKVL